MSTSQLEPPAFRRPSDMMRPAGERGDSELSLLSAVNVLLRRRALVVRTAAVVLIAVVTVTLLRSRTYTSSASFVPQTTRAPASGGGIAAQLGLSMLSADATQSPSFYTDLLTSRGILDSTVTTRFRVEKDGRVIDAPLVDLLEVKAKTPARRLEAAYLALGRAISADPSLKTGVVNFSVRSSDPMLSKQIADRLLELLNAFNLRRRRTQASEERRFAEDRLNEARAELRTAEDRLQSFLQRNRVYASAPELRFEEDRLSREVNMRQQLYTTVAQAYEQARMDEVRDTPVITVIEQPNVPARPDSRGLLKWLVVGMVLGLGLGVGLAYLRELMDRTSVEPGSEVDQFHDLWRATVSDLTHPWRFVTQRPRRGSVAL